MTDRGKFGTPESTYAGKRVCVTGTTVEYCGRPEIVATDPSQISTEPCACPKRTPQLEPN
jgi:hypothetical protein